MPDIEDSYALLDGGHIDLTTFSQITEMDEPDDHEFSSSIVYGFFEQAEQTFEKIKTSLQEKDLESLSSLGHFLKGSSATLGLVNIRDSCEKIQNYGAKKDAAGNPAKPGTSDAEFLSLIESAFVDVKRDYGVVEKQLRKFYESFEES